MSEGSLSQGFGFSLGGDHVFRLFHAVLGGFGDGLGRVGGRVTLTI